VLSTEGHRKINTFNRFTPFQTADISDKQDCEILERLAMKVFYDSHTDTLSVILKDNVAVHESDEDKPGVILDYDKEGNLISLEILDASKRVTDTRNVDVLRERDYES